MKKVLWLYSGERNIPLSWAQRLSENMGIDIEIKAQDEDFPSAPFEWIIVLADSLSWHSERLLEFAFQKNINPLKIRFFPWQEIQRIFPTTAFQVLENFCQGLLQEKEPPLARTVRLLPERNVLVLPQIEEGLEEAFGQFGLRVFSFPSPLLVKKEGINFALYHDSQREIAGAIVLFAEHRERLPFSLSQEAEETGRVVPLTHFEEILSRKKIRQKVIVFVVSSRNQSIREWERVFSLSANLAREEKAQVWVLTDEVMVAAPYLEERYRKARCEGVLFEKTKLENLVAQPTIDMQGLWLAFESERDRYRQRFRADWVVYVPERECLPVTELSWWRDDVPVEALFDLENPNLAPFSSALQGVFVIPRFDRNRFPELARVVNAYLCQGRIAVPDCGLVEEEKCVLCLTCLRTCPWKAIEVEGENKRKRARIQWERCHLCGICMAFCPAAAIGVNSLPRNDFLVLTCARGGEK